MIQTVESLQPLDPVKVAHPTPESTDVWLRQDEQTIMRDDPMGGTSYTLYMAREGQLRIDEYIDEGEAADRFDELWELAEEYNPATYVPMSDNLEAVRADVDYIAMETTSTSSVAPRATRSLNASRLPKGCLLH